jgi:predicted ATPase/DNA-binding CsgD family transcriptional regulator
VATRFDGDPPAPALSRREREVADLVAQGMTNRGIAERLFLSPRTVESHVQHVLDKLGLDRRAQIATWVTARRHHGGETEARPVERAVPRHNLPQQVTSFIGRERDLELVHRLLQRARLVTVAGPGGCGKTRLALEAAARATGRFPGGVWFAGLGSTGDPEAVPRVIAAGIGARERDGAGALDAIVSRLDRSARGARALVVLDNCEHLAAACAATVSALLERSATTSFLCTSREPLHVPGEGIWRLGPFSQAEAVRLFLDRVSLSDPGFALDDASSPQVMDLCRWLDGIPLALELAAARVGVMSIAEVLAHLEGRVGDLRTRGTPGRQQTVTATIDWSYDLLTEEERRTFRRLSVFRDGFTAEAADEIAGATVEDLARLADKSLIEAVPPARERYRCLELVRRYAENRLGESGELESVRRRHHAYHLRLAERAASELLGPAQPEWLDRLAGEHDNLRAALRCGNDAGTPEERLRFVLALYRFWSIRGHLNEGSAWAEEALRAGTGAGTPLRARVISAAASLAWQQGDLGRARAWHEECLSVWRALEDDRGIQYSLGNLGVVAWTQGDHRTARILYEESLALARQNGDEREVGIVLINLGLLAGTVGDLQAGEAHLRDALRIMRGLGDWSVVAAALANLGALALFDRRDAEADALYRESLGIQRALAARDTLPECLVGLATIAARRGGAERALRLAGAAAGIRETVGAILDPCSRRLLEQWLGEARESLGSDAGAVWEEGRQLADHDAIALALEDVPAPSPTPPLSGP